MKKFILAAMMLIPMASMAQDNTWEQPQVTNNDAKYLVGAVPEVDGRVVFQTTISAPGKTAAQIFDLLNADLQKMTKEPNQIEQSRVSLADAATGELVGQFQEWLVFKNKPLVLDRTRFFYTLMINCKDGAADVKLTRIHYLYDEERDATTYRQRSNRYKECFRQLPQEFTTEQFAQTFGYANNHSAQKPLQSLEEEKAIERTKRGSYKKLISEL